jgi:1-acyl-sn-glycerol-3-phosphate acyltransferase
MIIQNQLEMAAMQRVESVRRGLSGNPEKLLYWLGRSVVSLYTHTWLNIDVKWHVPLPEGPKILAANHPTTTDPFFILTLLPEPISVLVTGGAFDVPLFGSYLRQAGHIPALRNSGGRTVQQARELLEAGRTVAIFPEGALSPLSGGIGFHKPHSGVARLALSSGAPVVPVGISLDPARIRVLDVELEGQAEEGRVYTGGPYAMTIGKPLWFKGNTTDWGSVQQVSEQIMDRIMRLSQEGTRRLSQVPAPAPIPQTNAANLAGTAVYE